MLGIHSEIQLSPQADQVNQTKEGGRQSLQSKVQTGALKGCPPQTAAC